MATRQMLIGTVFPTGEPIYQGEGLAQSLILLAADPGEELESAESTLGIANLFTIETWVFWTGSLPTGNETPFSARPSVMAANEIVIGTNGGTGEISILMRDPASANIFIARFPQNSWTVDAWNMITLQHVGSAIGDTLVYMNGTLLVPSNIDVELGGTRTDTALTVHSPRFNSHDWDGFMFATTMWNSVLTQPEIQYRFDNQDGLASSKGWLDPTVNQGDYESASTCVHWWPFALDSGDVGADAQGTLDLTASNISGLSSEVP